MSWERQKSTVSAVPEEPSFILWLMIGIVALVGGVLLFVLHANKLAGPLQPFNLWVVAAGPLVVWVFFLCLRAVSITGCVRKSLMRTTTTETTMPTGLRCSATKLKKTT